jgi:hypothetical protein
MNVMTVIMVHLDIKMSSEKCFLYFREKCSNGP